MAYLWRLAGLFAGIPQEPPGCQAALAEHHPRFLDQLAPADSGHSAGLAAIAVEPAPVRGLLSPADKPTSSL